MSQITWPLSASLVDREDLYFAIRPVGYVFIMGSLEKHLVSGMQLQDHEGRLAKVLGLYALRFN